jgi:ABC-2 type transport system permease protein
VSTKLVAIAINTFIETVRQPIYGVLLWVAAFWIGFVSPSLAAFTLVADSDKKVMIDVSLSTLMLYGLLAAVFSASGVIAREIDSHTVLTVISKPVSRPVFLLGKYLGVTAAVLVGYYFLGLTLFMAARHGVMETASDEWDKPVLIFGLGAVFLSLSAATFGNYVYGWHFSTTLTAWVVPLATVALALVLCISPKWALQAPGKDFGNLQLLYGVIMAFCAVLVLTAFAVALSTRFSQVLTLMLCAGVFLLGLLSDYYLGGAARTQHGLLFQVFYNVVPNFQFFWVGDPLTEELTIPGQQVALAAGYAALYSLGVLAFGVALFQTREVS